MDTMLELARTVCWCGTPFMLPQRLLESAQNSAHTIYCPHGHSLTWKETETDRLRRERDRLKQREAMLQDETRLASERADRAYERAAKAEATTKRLKQKAAVGSCPCCKRTFTNMARHMQTKHPEFKADAVNVVPLRA